jgi:hypothetical protein
LRTPILRLIARMIFNDFFLTRNNPREFAWKKLLVDDLRNARGDMVSENALLGVLFKTSNPSYYVYLREPPNFKRFSLS